MRDIPKLQRQAVTLVNAHRVPGALAESLMSGVNALQTPVCLPAVPVTTPAETPAPPTDEGQGHGNGHHDKHHGHQGEGD